MRIIIFKGHYQYGVVNKFIDLVGKSVEDKNIEVIYIDINSKNHLEQLINIFSTQVIDCVIGFGGAGAEIQIENESIYNIVNTKFLAIQVDHPAHHLVRIAHPIKNYLISFVDKGHIDYVDEILPNHHLLKFFLPHGGTESDKPTIKNFEDYTTLKDIDLLFAGSYLGDPIKKWEKNSSFPTVLINKVIQLLLTDEYIAIHDAFNKIISQEKISLSLRAKINNNELIESIIWYVRRYKRLTVLTKLIQSGIKITVCGAGWENILSKYPNVTYKGELDFDSTIEVMRHAKVVLNVNPYFTQGSHERVLTAMLNGAVVFTDRSSFYDQFYREENDILYYSLETIEKDIIKLKETITDDNKLHQISTNSYKITKENHLWEHRAKQIVEMIAFSNKLL